MYFHRVSMEFDPNFHVFNTLGQPAAEAAPQKAPKNNCGANHTPCVRKPRRCEAPKHPRDPWIDSVPSILFSSGGWFVNDRLLLFLASGL